MEGSSRGLESLSRKARSFLYGRVKMVRGALLQPSEAEQLAKQATCVDFSGPSSSALEKLTEVAQTAEHRKRILNVIRQRLRVKGKSQEKNWAQLCKTLTVLEYLLRHGEMQIVKDISGSFALILEDLCEFSYKDGQGLEREAILRTKARCLLDMLNDSSTLEAARERAKRVADDTKRFKSIICPTSKGIQCNGTGFFILDAPRICSPSEYGVCVSPSYYELPHSPMYSDWAPQEESKGGNRWQQNQLQTNARAKPLEVPNKIGEQSSAEHSPESNVTPTSTLEGPNKSWGINLCQPQLPQSALTCATKWKAAAQEGDVGESCSIEEKLVSSFKGGRPVSTTEGCSNNTICPQFDGHVRLLLLQS